jgi:dTDP-4-dehydrorhamnose reductase
VVDDQRGSPTFTFDLARALADLLDVKATGILHVVNQGEATWRELAVEALAVAGMANVEVAPVTTAEYGAKAPRPAYSVLASCRLRELGIEPLPDWRASLREYFRRRPQAAPSGA